jgi:hypothetical protein
VPEFTPPQEDEGRPRHLPNIASTLVELHRLVSIFLASKAFADLVVQPVGHQSELHNAFFRLQECQEDEISRILLLLAITARVVDDANNQPLDLIACSCGTLVQDTSRPDITEPLELREACNKLIHASRRRFDVEHNERGRPYLLPNLYLYGTKGRLEWKATLDVLSFAEEYTSNVTLL